jgi:hypothetical protein
MIENLKIEGMISNLCTHIAQYVKFISFFYRFDFKISN